MTSTDTSEKGLERLICVALTGHPCDPGTTHGNSLRDLSPHFGGSGWIAALSTAGAEEEDETTEDRINRIMEARKLLLCCYPPVRPQGAPPFSSIHLFLN